MKILQDVMIQCDREVKVKKPDIVVVNKNERSGAIIDIAIPGVLKKRRKKLRHTKDYREKSKECGTLAT